MRKQLAIGVSMLALTALGGVSENNVSTNLQGASPQYTHFVRTSLNQTFEPLSGASLNEGLPYRTNYQTAGVHFIVSNQGADFGNDDAKNNDFSDPAGETCKNLGYTVTSCETGLFNKACPYNDALYDRCCDVTYKYTSSQCSSPKKLSSDSCGGKYRCYCDITTYPYASCNSPQIKGNSCTDDSGTRYATCTCPGSVATPYGCETYYASPCNSVCQKAYADNCRNRTSVQTPYGCETYFSDCKSKCQKAYADNCRNQTAVITSCPTNANCTYFADCKSKVQSWSCNSGYEKSGNSCVQAIKVGSIVYGDGTISNEVLSSKTPVGVVFDVENRLAVALTDVKNDGSPGKEYIYWSSSYCDTPNLENCTDKSTAITTCGTNGRANTNAILASTCNGTTYAANAVNSYQIIGCSKDFCQRGKWFLPSIKELYTIYSNMSTINNTLSSLSSKGASQVQEYTYWSSTENSNSTAWRLSMSIGDTYHNGKSNNPYYARPVVKY